MADARTARSPGPYVDQPASAAQKFPLSPDTLAALRVDHDSARSNGASARRAYSNIPNPLTNVFGRLDYQVNDVHRLVFRYNYSDGERLRQQNNRGTTTAVYSDNFHNFRNVKNAPVAQLFSNFKNGCVERAVRRLSTTGTTAAIRSSTFPQITHQHGRPAPNGNAAILAGADQFSQGNELDTKTWEFTENYTFRPMGQSHVHASGPATSTCGCATSSRRAPTACGASAISTASTPATPNSFRKAIILARRRQRLLQRAAERVLRAGSVGRRRRVSPSRLACAST